MTENFIFQLIYGIPLERSIGGRRFGLIFVLGTVFSSAVTPLFKPAASGFNGSSCGIYAVIFAEMAHESGRRSVWRKIRLIMYYTLIFTELLSQLYIG